MSEYIYRSNGEPLVNERGEIMLAYAGEVVRCRDCKFAVWDIFAWWCNRDKYQPFEIGELKDERDERSHLIGFCAWAERQEQ